jgi:hypothetical protein
MKVRAMMRGQKRVKGACRMTTIDQVDVRDLQGVLKVGG